MAGRTQEKSKSGSRDAFKTRHPSLNILYQRTFTNFCKCRNGNATLDSEINILGLKRYNTYLAKVRHSLRVGTENELQRRLEISLKDLPHAASLTSSPLDAPWWLNWAPPFVQRCSKMAGRLLRCCTHVLTPWLYGSNCCCWAASSQPRGEAGRPHHATRSSQPIRGLRWAAWRALAVASWN